ncbi:phloem protein 2-A8 [Arabidopsis lyrata subsp. lyrata]|uniref:Phloem protein 2-A8 n=1 Tax=Arabidopsis lyrata subsp. lyrata TaxID=81972 RepID=D7MW47_ARALL|nr:protein PHLOEM PROTEIN 2-LIKE A8 [Arabidopsis lyrata subsp. lyrata]EFH39237.1 phloem protein 2-A8 [Arabidopsis lyrata subsp. lyrata]|eukprot:XP_020874248.1 protein PHLOEM PROTEIN 2-LIKE A8 [Arabidopsis lyrata subsp. lyrata]
MAASSSVRPTTTGPQVFINFRGKDVRNGFLSFLEPAMREANINVFIDKHEVVGTDLVNLFVRIQESRVVVVIFSKDYTSSEWCLDELAQIKDCIDQGGLNVIPIFYKLAPSSVEELKGGFGDSFRVLKCKYKDEPERTQKWEEALKYIPKIKGLTLSEKSDRNEREFIYETIFEIQRSLSQIAVKGNPKLESNSLGGFMVPARRLVITHAENPEKWTWSAIYDRPHKADIEIATMINTHSLIKINGDFHTRKLIPGKKYEVVFLVRLDDTSLGWKNDVTLTLKLVMGDKTGNEKEKKLCLDEYIGENWVDILVGEFEAPPKKDDAKIFFSMSQYVDTDKKSGLVVKGFAIRPA